MKMDRSTDQFLTRPTKKFELEKQKFYFYFKILNRSQHSLINKYVHCRTVRLQYMHRMYTQLQQHRTPFHPFATWRASACLSGSQPSAPAKSGPMPMMKVGKITLLSPPLSQSSTPCGARTSVVFVAVGPRQSSSRQLEMG